MTLWSRDFQRSCDILKPLYLNFHSAYVTKLGRMVTYLEGTPALKLCNTLIKWSCKVTWQTKIISTTRVPVTNKCDSIVTYLNRLLPIKCNGSWSHGLAGSRDKLKLLNPHCHSVFGHHSWQYDDIPWKAPKSHLTLWSCGLARSLDKRKPLYLHYQSASGHQLDRVTTNLARSYL